MVRAGVVRHPSEWKFSGFNEIQKPRRRYSIIDYKSLSDLLNFDNYDELKRSHREWVEELLEEKKNVRDRKWTDQKNGHIFNLFPKKQIFISARPLPDCP